jgi:hypothetical protein
MNDSLARRSRLQSPTILLSRQHPSLPDGRIKCFNLLEGLTDGDQDLNLWIRDMEDVCQELMEEPLFKGNQNFQGNQNFHFETDLDKFGERMFGCEANAGMECHFRLVN